MLLEESVYYDQCVLLAKLEILESYSVVINVAWRFVGS